MKPLLGRGLNDSRSGILESSGSGKGVLMNPLLGRGLDDSGSGILDGAGTGLDEAFTGMTPGLGTYWDDFGSGNIDDSGTGDAWSWCFGSHGGWALAT